VDLSQLANPAELFGVAAIVVSLIYVSMQLKQTNSMMKNAAASERLERDYQLVLPLIESREVAEISVRGGQNFSELDDVDQQRLLFFERRAIVLWHHVFQMQKQKLYSNPYWYETVEVIRTIGRRQAVREAWRLFSDHFDPEFAEFVDEQFAIADAQDDRQQ